MEYDIDFNSPIILTFREGGDYGVYEWSESGWELIRLLRRGEPEPIHVYKIGKDAYLILGLHNIYVTFDRFKSFKTFRSTWIACDHLLGVYLPGSFPLGEIVKQIHYYRQDPKYILRGCAFLSKVGPTWNRLPSEERTYIGDCHGNMCHYSLEMPYYDLMTGRSTSTCFRAVIGGYYKDGPITKIVNVFNTETLNRPIIYHYGTEYTYGDGVCISRYKNFIVATIGLEAFGYSLDHRFLCERYVGGNWDGWASFWMNSWSHDTVTYISRDSGDTWEGPYLVTRRGLQNGRYTYGTGYSSYAGWQMLTGPLAGFSSFLYEPLRGMPYDVYYQRVPLVSSFYVGGDIYSIIGTRRVDNELTSTDTVYIPDIGTTHVITVPFGTMAQSFIIERFNNCSGPPEMIRDLIYDLIDSYSRLNVYGPLRTAVSYDGSTACCFSNCYADPTPTFTNSPLEYFSLVFVIRRRGDNEIIDATRFEERVKRISFPIIIPYTQLTLPYAQWF